MCEIKLINKDTDLSNLSRLNWDACNGNMQLDVYLIEGYVHSIGGRWGNNCYWCCPRGEEPIFENLMEFSGNACNWGFKINEYNYDKYKWEEHEILKSVRVEILRNDKVFYTFVVNNFDYGVCKARKLLFDIHEHPVSFSDIHFEKHIIDRKIMYDGIPAIIKEYAMNSNLIIYPEKAYEKKFKKYEDGFVVDDLFSHYINWHMD